MDNINKIITIGTSMGGLKALRRLLENLPELENSAIFIVQHSSNNQETILHKILNKESHHNVQLAKDGQEIQAKTIYVSPSNYHLMLEKDRMLLGEGPHEQNSRPSINQLMRSAAISYKEKVIGVVLTGLLYDGIKGLEAINSCGGISIIQNPNEAEYPEMPRAALDQVSIDYIADLMDMGPLLNTLVKKSKPEFNKKIPQALSMQVKMGLKRPKENHVIPYFKSYDLSKEDTILYLINMIQERVNLLENMAEEDILKGRNSSSRITFQRAREHHSHLNNLREMLIQHQQRAS